MVALGTDRLLYSWGSSEYGLNGNGAKDDQFVAKQVKTPAGVTFSQIAPFSLTALALDTTGNIYAWGHKGYEYGVIGNGSDKDEPLPVRIAPPAGVRFTSITAAQRTSLATASNGYVYAWGANNEGQYGNLTKVSSTTPVAVAP